MGLATLITIWLLHGIAQGSFAEGRADLSVLIARCMGVYVLKVLGLGGAAQHLKPSRIE